MKIGWKIGQKWRNRKSLQNWKSDQKWNERKIENLIKNWINPDCYCTILKLDKITNLIKMKTFLNLIFEFKCLQLYFHFYLFFDIFEGWRRNYRVTDQEDICLWIRKWPQAIIIFLTRSIEETQSVRLTTNHNCHCIIVKHLKKQIFVEFSDKKLKFGITSKIDKNRKGKQSL